MKLPEVRPIDANWLKSWVKRECNPYGNPTIGFGDGRRFMEQIDKMPTLEPEVQHAYWEPSEIGEYHCTCCGVECDVDEFHKALLNPFCGNCGAKMNGGING